MMANNYKFTCDYDELKTIYDFESKSLIDKKKIDFVISHGRCTDGFMSATIAWKWFKENGIDVGNIQFYQAYYGSDFSNLPDLIKNKTVLICDISFKKELFEKMIIATNGNILLLDHHKTAQIDLKNISEKYNVFDMNHSGAFITWTYFYGFNNIPKAILYVEDNDIWAKKLPCTNEFTSYIFSRNFSFDEYIKFFDEDYLASVVFPIGTGMLNQNKFYVESLSEKSIPVFMLINGRYYFVAMANSAILKSDIGNSVLSFLKNANFSAIYDHDHYRGSTSFSLRSLPDRTDSTEIAKLSGGGGHRNASGTVVEFIVDTIPGKVIDKSGAYYLMDHLYARKMNGKNILFLNSPVQRVHLSKYLMQERFFGDEINRNNKRYERKLPGYQEGMYCMRNILKDDKYDEHFDGAVIWYYDGSKYTADCKFLESMTKLIVNNKELLDQNMYNITVSNNIVTVSASDTIFTIIDFITKL